MKALKKTLVILAVAFVVAGMSSSTQAHCGSCGTEDKRAHGDEHKKGACVKCEHAKNCEAEDCKDAAHQAKCTCPKKQEEKELD